MLEYGLNIQETHFELKMSLKNVTRIFQYRSYIGWMSACLGLDINFITGKIDHNKQ